MPAWIRDGKVKAGRLGKSYLTVGADLLARIRGEEPRELTRFHPVLVPGMAVLVWVESGCRGALPVSAALQAA